MLRTLLPPLCCTASALSLLACCHVRYAAGRAERRHCRATLGQLSADFCIRDVTGEPFWAFDIPDDPDDPDEHNELYDLVAALKNLVDFAEMLCEEVTADAELKEVGNYDFEDDYVVMKKGVAEWLSDSFGLPGWGASAQYFEHGDPSVTAAVRRRQEKLAAGGGDDDGPREDAAAPRRRDGLQEHSNARIPPMLAAETPAKPVVYVSQSYLLSYSASLAPLPVAELFINKCRSGSEDDEEAFATLYRAFKREDKVFRDNCNAQFKSGNGDGVPSLKAFVADAKVAELVLVRRKLLQNFMTGEAFRFDILPRMVHASFWARAPVNADGEIVPGWKPMDYKIAFKPR